MDSDFRTASGQSAGQRNTLFNWVSDLREDAKFARPLDLRPLRTPFNWVNFYFCTTANVPRPSGLMACRARRGQAICIVQIHLIPLCPPAPSHGPAGRPSELRRAPARRCLFAAGSRQDQLD